MIRNLLLFFIGSIFIISIVASFFGVMLMLEDCFFFSKKEAKFCTALIFLLGSASVFWMKRREE